MATIEKETNAPTVYGKYVDKCLNEAAKHFFSEREDKYSVADLFYAGVRCGKSWFEKQNEQETLCDKCKSEEEAIMRRALRIIQNSFYGGTYVPTKAMKLISKINVFDKTKSVKDIVKQFEKALTEGTWTEYDQDMLTAIDCLTKQGRHLEKEHLDWIKSLKDRKGLKEL